MLEGGILNLTVITPHAAVKPCHKSPSQKEFPDLRGMPRKKIIEYRESPYAKDIVRIMQASPGPMTRGQIATALAPLYPKLYKQDLMNAVSGAIQLDKWSGANRFQFVKLGWYGLAGREY